MTDPKSNQTEDDPESVLDGFQSKLYGSPDELLSDRVLELAYEPVNVGEIENADAIGYVQGSCGDTMTIYLKISDSIIHDARFLSDGCGVTLACGSSVTRLAKGISCRQASLIQPQAVIQDLDGLPASHLHCAVLAVHTLKDALDHYKKT